jgi:outer membrane lipoprotein carrier protein
VALTKRPPRLLRLLTVLLLCVGSFLLCAGSNADAVIQTVEKRYNGAQTLAVDFVENYSVIGHPRPPESGRLTLRKVGKMRWDYSQPKGKLFISDGKNVFLYTAQDNRVEKIPLKDTEDMRAPLAFLLGRLDMKKEFGNFELRSGEGGIWLDASAKNDRIPYASVDMLVKPDGRIQELKVLGRDESVTAFSFSNEKLNAPAPNDLFHFDIPPGAEVVDAINAGSVEQ